MLVGDNTSPTPVGYIRIEPMKSNTVEGTWRWGQDTAKEKLSYLHARYMPNKKQWSIFEWQYLDKRDLVKPTSVWTFKDVNSERGTELFRNLGFDKNQFPNPKPVGTIERILQIATKKDAIVLDSYAGSGTTAHAVLRQNRADGGHRRFVLVELMDYAETITAERVRRVMAGYGDGEKAVEGTGGGFSFYELGAPILADGKLNEDAPLAAIQSYIYYTETREACAPQEEPYLLGVKGGTAYYFIYEKERETTLDAKTFSTLKTRAESYVIYADLCTLSPEELVRHHICFKKIPRDIVRM